MNNVCFLCNQYIGNSDSIILINGAEIHKDCYSGLLNPQFEESTELSRLYSDKRQLENLIERNSGIISSLGRFFNQKNKINYSDQIELRNQLINKCKPLENSINEKRNFINLRLKSIYDFWFERPPDWINRQYLINEKYGHKCCSCGTHRYLQVHHINHIKNGGTHQLDNLILLCRSCHEDKHGGADFKGEYKSSSEKSVFLKRLEKINEALKNNKDIHFHYKKYEGEESIRTIKPKGLRMEGTSLCVYGYCFLRKDERIFAIRRMTDISIK